MPYFHCEAAAFHDGVHHEMDGLSKRRLRKKLGDGGELLEPSVYSTSQFRHFTPRAEPADHNLADSAVSSIRLLFEFEHAFMMILDDLQQALRKQRMSCAEPPSTEGTQWLTLALRE